MRRYWEEVEKPVHLSINAGREYLLQWREIKAKQENVRPAAINTQVTWQPPADGEFKCNVDAALFNEEQQFGMGMCIRGAHGSFVKVGTMVIEGTPPPLEAEAYALKEALIWLEEIGISRV
ncbi:60S ribosomal protein L23, partial [Trifolium medium]|nr:60S ribosomal protein L23 [Trifolium medium]